MSKNTFKSITDGYLSDFASNYYKKRSGSVPGTEGFVNEYHRIFANDSVDLIKSSQEVLTPPEYTYQTFLRPLFGKSGINSSKVGAHPDFENLKFSGDIEHHHIVTMFVDIKRSSRLALLMSLEEAYMVKNRILQACVDVVRSLDGYPHRLMGDALMAYFGDKRTSSEDAIANAINAASTLKFILSEYVFPELDKIVGRDIKLGVRIGLDYGSDEEIIWANYGYGDASEVTALGIPVDLASKAQSQARKNTAMLGQGVLEHIDFPKRYSEIKEVKRNNGIVIKEEYILPNMEKSDGTKLNRICRLLRMDNYQSLLPFSPSDKTGKKGISNLNPNNSFRFSCQYREDENSPWKDYPSVSSFLDKSMDLRFLVEIESREFAAYGDLVAVFTKSNHGIEANSSDAEKEWVLPEVKIESPSTSFGYTTSKVEHKESTAYRGLHTMEVKISPKKNKGVTLFKDIIGIYIK